MPSIVEPRSLILCRVVPAAIGVVIAAMPAIAQTQLWVHQFGTSSNEGVYAALSDSTGGVFAAGATDGSLGGTHAGETDAWLAHLDASGAILWQRQDGLPSFDGWTALALDDGGGVLAFGSYQSGGPTGWDIRYAHFDASGGLVWMKRVIGSGKDMLSAATPDGAGGFFVAGATDGNLGGAVAGGMDVWLAHLSSDGAVNWVEQFGSGADDSVFRSTPDGVGGVYLAGRTTGSLFGGFAGLADAWVARFDATGGLVWGQQLGTQGFEDAKGVALDGAGGVFVGGVADSPLGGPGLGCQDVWLARITSDGNTLWTEKFGTTGCDSPFSVEADGQGGAYMAGETSGELGGPTLGFTDAWLARYDSDGNELWATQFGSTNLDFTFAGTADDEGGVWIGGLTWGDLGAPNAGGDDIWLARFDGSCNSGETYCVASSTSISGCSASISATGSPTLSNPTAWTVSSGPVPGGNLGLLLFGSSGKDSTPYGTLGGKLCVAAPTFRTAPKTSGGDQGQCNGAYAFTLADLIAAAPIVTSGATIHAQVWARDPANPDGFLLSDGIEATVCP